MQDSLLFLGVWTTHLCFGEFSRQESDIYSSSSSLSAWIRQYKLPSTSDKAVSNCGQAAMCVLNDILYVTGWFECMARVYVMHIIQKILEVLAQISSKSVLGLQGVLQALTRACSTPRFRYLDIWESGDIGHITQITMCIYTYIDILVSRILAIQLSTCCTLDLIATHLLAAVHTCYVNTTARLL